MGLGLQRGYATVRLQRAWRGDAKGIDGRGERDESRGRVTEQTLSEAHFCLSPFFFFFFLLSFLLHPTLRLRGVREETVEGLQTILGRWSWQSGSIYKVLRDGRITGRVAGY